MVLKLFVESLCMKILQRFHGGGGGGGQHYYNIRPVS